MNFTIPMGPRTLTRTTILVLAFAVLLTPVLGQTATNACGYNVGNQYAVNASCSFQTFNKPTSFTNTYTPTGCNASAVDDAWGWFTATSTSTYITFDPNNADDPIMSVFTGACGSLTQVGCVDAGGYGFNANLTLTTVIGTNYMIRIEKHGLNSSMNGRLCIWNLPPPPANDEPCSAVVLDIYDNCSLTAATNASATATVGPPPPGCANYAGGDVWFQFVAPASGMVRVETGVGTLTDSGMALYSATACAGTFALISCDDDSGTGNMSLILSPSIIPGNTYYIRVWGYGGAFGSFNICATNAGPPPNDDPCGAISLSLTSTCTTDTYSSMNATSTTSIPAPDCGTYSGNDVWFSFVAPASGLVTIQTPIAVMTNLDMAVYSASSCSGPFTLIACDASSGPGSMPFMTLTPLELIAGQTYYVRVWGNYGTTGLFDLCANTAPIADCVYVLRMFDSQGDGWGSSNVSVQVGAGPAVSYTNTNSDQEVAYIPVTTGDLIQLAYNTGGSGNQGEISYILQLQYGMAYSDGPTPGTGSRYAAIADCQSAPPLNSDCYGHTAICNAQQISSNPSNTGLTADLNVNNRDCLGSNERQGTWYSFSPSAGGTVAFTIAPTNTNDDYDFAIWGPFVSLSCPPRVQPMRCNYSGTTGNTGLATTASNPSESASGSKWSSAMTVAAGEYYILYISNWSRSGLAFDLTWQLTNGASLDCTLLPVEFLGLNGYPVPEGINLEWSTATEHNSSQFAVERMNAQGAFEQIGAVAAAGASNNMNSYAFLDEQPLSGWNHYRLMLIDMDGSSEATDAVAVMHRSEFVNGALYPDPASDKISFQLANSISEQVTLSIFDASGRLTQRETRGLGEGSTQVTMMVDALDPGSYVLVVDDRAGSFLYTGRFMVE
ncbi:MAG: T9SS type A sorting domain-containing protein [Flavobacteriales bacterium]|nr:T9SS type A sorting domain-containing protein [Flavobacteriales bacterium]MBK8710251.1 T9SS type A sorting domain-containing protein [Flavobacteriales bacterium]